MSFWRIGFAATSALLVIGSVVNVDGAGDGDELFQARVTEVRKKLTADPKNRRGWVLLGNLNFDAGKAQDAVDAYQQALDLKPDDPDVLCDQGMMFGRLGQGKKAIENFERALAINPRHAQSLYNAGIIASEQLNEPGRALSYWKKLVEVDPKSPASVSIKAFIERVDKDLERMKAGKPVAVESAPPANK